MKIFEENKFVVFCPNCHTIIEKGDIYCKGCKKLLVRINNFGGEK